MKKRIALWLLVIVAAAAGSLTVPNMVQSSIPAIYYITPKCKTYENVVHCSGTILPEQEYNVCASSAMVPADIPVSLGDIVEEGDVLMTVDRAATERLSQNFVGELASRASASGGELGGGIPAADLQTILSAYGFADLLGGVDLAALIGAGGAETPAASHQASISLTEPLTASVAAPATGMITEVAAIAGSPVTAGQLLFSIQDVKSYKVMVTVGEADISKIAVGDRALIRGAGFSGSTYGGTVRKIYPTARKVLSGTTADTVVDVEIFLEKPNNLLKSGFSAKVEISGNQSYDLVTVPYEAIRQDENNDEYVYVYEGGKLKKRPIITGRELVSEVEVLEGLEVDSIVIYNPDDVPGEGSIVNIKGRAAGV